MPMQDPADGRDVQAGRDLPPDLAEDLQCVGGGLQACSQLPMPLGVAVCLLHGAPDLQGQRAILAVLHPGGVARFLGRLHVAVCGGVVAGLRVGRRDPAQQVDRRAVVADRFRELLRGEQVVQRRGDGLHTRRLGQRMALVNVGEHEQRSDLVVGIATGVAPAAVTPAPLAACAGSPRPASAPACRATP
jgi:hypothetical protein